MNSINGYWGHFENACGTLTQRERDLAESAFYAGSLGVMSIIKNLPRDSTEAGKAILQGLDAEIEDFAIRRLLQEMLGVEAAAEMVASIRAKAAATQTRN